jgi:2,3-bisphosphoglycerate-dependent phosphoglycerate mutase
MKRIYLVRHCQASGQESEAPLTAEGERQADELAEFMRDRQIERIVSSPYVRAMQSVKPLSERLGLEIHIDDRLRERVLSTSMLDDWLKRYEETFLDDDLKFPGGESSAEATGRGLAVIEEATARPEHACLIVTHGGLLSLIIRHYNREFGFEDWRRLTNPDVYELQIHAREAVIRRIWT